MVAPEPRSITDIAQSPAATGTASAANRQPRSRTEPPSPYLQLEGIHKNFGPFVALKNIYLDVYPGEFVCLLGPSGCGKTTLLRIIAGLETQSQGRVIQKDQDVSRLPPSRRDFGIVFQSYALFPNLTAAENVAYGLHNTRKPKAEIRDRVTELLNLVGLEGFAPQYPSQLSGGQQQRVALARALALSPSLLLLDEPLSALDAKVRVKLRTEIARLQKQLGVTTVMVTHDQSEALAMADRVVVMDKGIIAQVGTPRAIYQHPSTPFVANFIGVMNFLGGVVVAADQVRCGNVVLETPSNDVPVDQVAHVAIRPEDIRVLPAGNQVETANTLTAQVQSFEFLGSGYRVLLSPDGNAKETVVVEISAQESRTLDLKPDMVLRIQFPPELIRVFSSQDSMS
ncbi:putative 2-aminoethylphosphonate ABC transporter ATP-binding protein [Leptolyngbya sp. PCC 6406]|uniref:putative 2-aminoethylphosphonate ABC transporter ATP-binding protein n=1 Tax=Leptolyngbya sp. PCC 6406 TaxID=1173264 RepID=UPI0002ACBAC2|nr:putative 2-aminoethylphosphonate ABC transporter ATP-binding protein [Leptolyngbya sp. PCC 6406]